jgi:hypothetical protein
MCLNLEKSQMAKKISYIVLSIAILISGYFALTRLNYWERSIRIFKLSNSAQSFEGRRMRGPGTFRGNGANGGREGFNKQGGFRGIPDGSEVHQLPDSTRARFGVMDGRQGIRNRNVSDSLRQRSMVNKREMGRRGQFEAGIRGGQGRGRGEFPGGKKIYLRNVLWFLAVFASFTVLAIYFEKAYYLIWKRKLK